jgi:hypothetical protein
MWHIPRSKRKRSAILLVATSIFLGGPFLNHPNKVELCWLVAVLSLIFAYGLSDYIFDKERKNIAAFLLTFSVGCSCCILVAWHFWPRNGPSILSFDALYVGVGNMPERTSDSVKTWNGRPWEEDSTADIRLHIRNGGGVRIEKLDLTVTGERDQTADNPEVVKAWRQLSEVAGVEFYPSQLIQGITLRLRSRDGKSSSNLPLSPRLPPRSITVWAPNLLENEQIELILGTSENEKGEAPNWMKVDGSYQVESHPITVVHTWVEVKK